MKQKHYTLLLISSLLLYFYVDAQDDISDAIYLKLEKEYILNEDGSYDFRQKKQLKLLTYYSFHRAYGETFIIYNTKYQNLKINESYTIMADGKRVQTPANAFNELLPFYAEEAPDHNYLREMVVTHTGLERNAVINLDHTIHNQKDFLPFFNVTEFIGESSPVDELIIRIKIPVNKTAKFELLNSAVIPEIKEENKMRVFTWKFNNIPEYQGEAFQANRITYMPHLLFSTAKDRDEFFNVIIKQAAFEYRVNDKMRKKVGSFRTDASDDVDLALRIQKYVVDEFKIKYIPSRDIGFRYRQADEIWESAYATSAEKMIMLTALLTTANIDATPYASISSNHYTDEICVPVITDYVVKVNNKDGTHFYLNADKINSQDMAYQLSDMVLIPLSHATDKKAIIEKPGKNEIEMEAILTISNNGLIDGKISAELSYASNPRLEMKRDEQRAKKLIAGGIISSNISVTNISITPVKSSFTFEVNAKKELSEKAGYLFFELPYVNTGTDGFKIHELSSQRKSPLAIPYDISEESEYVIKFADGLKLVNSAVKIDEKNAAGRVAIEIKIKSNEVKITRSITIYKKHIETADYEAFRVLMKLWNDRNYREIVVKTK